MCLSSGKVRRQPAHGMVEVRVEVRVLVRVLVSEGEVLGEGPRTEFGNRCCASRPGTGEAVRPIDSSLRGNILDARSGFGWKAASSSLARLAACHALCEPGSGRALW